MTGAVLVVGGAGYVGSVLVRALLAQGRKTRVVDNFLYRNALSLEGVFDEPNFSFVYGDFCNPEVLHRALDGVDDVVLLAALVGDPISKRYPELTRRVNQDGSKALFQCLAQHEIRRFVFTSTCSNYGMRGDDSPVGEDAALDPRSLYAETKVAFERFVLDQKSETNLCATILRIATAYGLSPRMRFDLTVNEFAYFLARGEALDVYDKETWRPYCHVRDIARAIIAVLGAPENLVSGEVFNVGSDDDNYTKAMIVEEILKHVQGPVRFVDGGVDPRNYRVSFRKIASALGYSTEHSVASFIPQLIEAVRSDLFCRAKEIPDYYGNYRVWTE